jgi:hypothetical protein
MNEWMNEWRNHMVWFAVLDVPNLNGIQVTRTDEYVFFSFLFILTV